jgi:hypothetical protein
VRGRAALLRGLYYRIEHLQSERQVLYTDIPTSSARRRRQRLRPWRMPHISARYMSARVRTTAGGNWTHLQGVEVRVRPEGYR